MATHSSVLAWRIPGTGETGGLLSMGSHRVGHDWRNLVVVVASHSEENSSCWWRGSESWARKMGNALKLLLDHGSPLPNDYSDAYLFIPAAQIFCVMWLRIKFTYLGNGKNLIFWNFLFECEFFFLLINYFLIKKKIREQSQCTRDSERGLV